MFDTKIIVCRFLFVGYTITTANQQLIYNSGRHYENVCMKEHRIEKKIKIECVCISVSDSKPSHLKSQIIH